MADQAVRARIDNDILVEVLKGITSGLNYVQLVKFLQDRGVTVCPTELPAYFLEANRYFRDAAKYMREVEVGKSIERLNNLYMNSLKIQDFKACLSIQKEINALLGLKQTTPGEWEGEFSLVLPAPNRKPAKKGKARK